MSSALAAVAKRGLASLAILALAVIPLSSPSGAAVRPAGASAGSEHQVLFFDARAFATAVATAGPVRPLPGVRGLIVPHHWLAGRMIVGPIRDLAAGADVKRVILLGPNHIGTSGMDFVTSDRPWRTAFGRVDPDREAVASLARSGLVVAPEILTYEHSISGLVPAIGRFFPGALLVPIAVRGRPDAAARGALVDGLRELMTPGTVVIGSVDFSHYRSAEDAARRDAETISALETLDQERILRFGNEHMDSPATIALLLSVMESAGSTRVSLLDHSSSSAFGGSIAPPNVTSYLCVAFR